MRIYSFQIHTENGEFDQVYNFENFADMVDMWNKKKEYWKNCADAENVLIDEEPAMDECGEVDGRFQILNSDETATSFKAYDYDVM